MPKTNETDLMVSGFKLSHLILINKEKVNHKDIWTCQCDCGKRVKRRQDYLVKCVSKTERILSCGCKHPARTSIGSNSKTWRGCGDLSGEYFSQIKHGAKTRNLELSITIKDAWNLYLKQDSKCALTGRTIKISQSARREEQTASLDRIDSTKGYTIDNIQWIHKDINLMKNDFDQEYFIQCCKEVCERNK